MQALAKPRMDLSRLYIDIATPSGKSKTSRVTGAPLSAG